MTYYVECDGKMMDCFEDEDSALTYAFYLLDLHEGDETRVTIVTDTETLFEEIA